MKSNKSVLALLAFVAACAFGASASASTTVYWANLTSATAGTVTGKIGSIDVTYTGNYDFAQINNVGTDYWVDLGYTEGVVNRPQNVDLIALAAGGVNTLTFSQPVNELYMAFTSWNGVTADFSEPFSVVSQGCGYWGCGSFQILSSTSFVGNGELHGVIKFDGPITTLTFTDTSETWHGFTVGTVPEPATWLMMLLGFGAVGVMLRGRRTTRTACAA